MAGTWVKPLIIGWIKQHIPQNNQERLEPNRFRDITNQISYLNLIINRNKTHA